VLIELTTSDVQPRDGPVELADQLVMMNQEGDFSISVLADRNGLPVASVSQAEEGPELQVR
jgi:hypothetical protein